MSRQTTENLYWKIGDCLPTHRCGGGTYICLMGFSPTRAFILLYTFTHTVCHRIRASTSSLEGVNSYTSIICTISFNFGDSQSGQCRIVVSRGVIEKFRYSDGRQWRRTFKKVHGPNYNRYNSLNTRTMKYVHGCTYYDILYVQFYVLLISYYPWINLGSLFMK